jgi:hypothetical protein
MRMQDHRRRSRRPRRSRSRPVGVSETIKVASAPDRVEPCKADRGRFDVAIEASGDPAELLTA